MDVLKRGPDLITDRFRLLVSLLGSACRDDISYFVDRRDAVWLLGEILEDVPPPLIREEFEDQIERRRFLGCR